MNLPDDNAEKSQPAQAPRMTLILMAAMVICLSILAVFANFQRSRRNIVEVVAVKATISPTPQER